MSEYKLLPIVNHPDIEVLVDLEDHERLVTTSWYVDTHKDIIFSGRHSNRVSLWRHILGEYTTDCWCQFLNGNRFDFRRSNLRLKNGCVSKHRDKFRAVITVQRKNYHVGYAKTYEEGLKLLDQVAHVLPMFKCRKNLTKELVKAEIRRVLQPVVKKREKGSLCPRPRSAGNRELAYEVKFSVNGHRIHIGTFRTQSLAEYYIDLATPVVEELRRTGAGKVEARAALMKAIGNDPSPEEIQAASGVVTQTLHDIRAHNARVKKMQEWY